MSTFTVKEVESDDAMKTALVQAGIISREDSALSAHLQSFKSCSHVRYRAVIAGEATMSINFILTATHDIVRLVDLIETSSSFRKRAERRDEIQIGEVVQF